MISFHWLNPGVACSGTHLGVVVVTLVILVIEILVGVVVLVFSVDRQRMAASAVQKPIHMFENACKPSYPRKKMNQMMASTPCESTYHPYRAGFTQPGRIETSLHYKHGYFMDLQIEIFSSFFTDFLHTSQNTKREKE